MIKWTTFDLHCDL